jgi:hypothetical protein
LHTKIDPEKFLDDIVTKKSSLLKSIHHHDMLFGILVGYGKHNAFLYKKSKSLCRILCSKKIKLECSDKDFYPMMLVNPVQFMVDPNHPETKILQYKYKNLHQKISHLYSQGDLLEITLNELTSLN